MSYREIKIEDYDKIILFWRENYVVAEVDSREKFKLFLEKNPDLSILSEDGDTIIGTVLGSFDGRRGYIQKLVVAKDFRKNCLGQELVKKVLEKLREVGAVYVPIACEDEYLSFYEGCGFKQTGLISINKSL